MNKVKEKDVPKKNYYIVLLVSVLVIILCLYIRSFYLNYKANEIDNSIFFDKSINQINESDIDFALSETTEAILYVGNSGNSKVKNMEKRLYKLIENKNVTDRIIYWNVNKYSEKEYINILKNKFPVISHEIGKAPLLIYIKNGEGIEAFNSNDKLIDENVLNTLLSKYGIE